MLKIISRNNWFFLLYFIVNYKMKEYNFNSYDKIKGRKTYMQYVQGTKELGLPDMYRFGVELEAFNVTTGLPIGENSRSLYYSKESKEFLRAHRWKTTNFLTESLNMDGGAELVSPILYDKEEDWQNLRETCEHMKKYPGKHGKEVITDDKCGCHIHIDARTLRGKTKEQSDAIMKNFLSLWAESEELMYKMCNDVGDPIRSGTMNVKGSPIHKLASKMQRIKGMAMPIGEKIHKAIQNDDLKVSNKKFGRLKRALSKLKLNSARYSGLNLTNIGNPDKDTVEFRIANGTLNPEVIKQNVYLYASLIETARTMTLQPERLGTKIDDFYKTDVDEKTKVDNFLRLVFENEQDQDIYRERWQSVRNAEVYRDNNKKGFAPNRFRREEFKQIAKRTPAAMAREAFAQIKTTLQEKKREGIETCQSLESEI